MNHKVEVATVLIEQLGQRLEVRAQAAQDALLFHRIGHRHFDRAVEPQRAVAHALQQGHGALQHEIAGQHVVAKARPRAFDGAGGRKFLGAGEQRNLAHLHQVHAHRVVDADARAAGHFFDFLFDQQLFGRVDHFTVGLLVVKRVDLVDPFVVHDHRVAVFGEFGLGASGRAGFLRFAQRSFGPGNALACGGSAAIDLFTNRGFSGVFSQLLTPRCRTGFD